MVDEVAGDRIHPRIKFVDASVVEGSLAGSDAGFRAVQFVGGQAKDHATDEAVVRAEKINPVAAGVGDAFVHGFVDAAVGLGDERAEAVALRFEPLTGAIGRGAVDHDNVGLDVALLPNAGERQREVRARIFADDNDAELGRGGHCVRESIAHRRAVSMPELIHERSKPLLSVVIVAYKSRDEIAACLGSIPRELAGGPRGDGMRGAVEVCVVDNSAGTADGVGAVVQRDFPWVDYVAAETNLGFGRANNLGYARTCGEFVLFLNPDTMCNLAALAHCVARLEADFEIGLISPKLVMADGTMDQACRRGIPTLWDGFCRAAGLSAKWPRARLFAGYNLTFLPENETYDVGAINGAFMLGARWLFAEEVAEDGAVFDEQFFMYGDDLDLCVRVGRAGFRIVYDGRVAITHLKGVSVAKDFDVMSRAIFDANREVFLKHFVPHGEGAWLAVRAWVVKTKFRMAFGIWKAVALLRAKWNGHQKVRPL